MSLTAFTLFLQLPPEIRLKIWEASISHKPTLLPRNPISGLEACHKSRTVYLSTYTLCFYSIMHELLEYPISPYANYELDILYIDPEIDDMGILGRKSRIAIEDDLWRDLDPEEGGARTDDGVDARRELLRMEGLKELLLVLTSSHPMDNNEPEDGEGKDIDTRRLVKNTVTRYEQDGYVKEDVCEWLEEAEEDERLPGWEAPDLNLVMLIYEKLADTA